MAFAACSGAQSGSITNAIPAVGAPQATAVTSVTTPSINKRQHLAGTHKTKNALILIANENTGLGGSIRGMPKAPTEMLRPAPSSITSTDLTPSPSVQPKASALQTATSSRAAKPRSKPLGWPAIS
jgi:hypothetical protein